MKIKCKQARYHLPFASRIVIEMMQFATTGKFSTHLAFNLNTSFVPNFLASSSHPSTCPSFDKINQLSVLLRKTACSIAAFALSKMPQRTILHQQRLNRAKPRTLEHKGSEHTLRVDCWVGDRHDDDMRLTARSVRVVRGP